MIAKNLIVLLGTGKYKEFCKGTIATLGRVCPGETKALMLISDDNDWDWKEPIKFKDGVSPVVFYHKIKQESREGMLMHKPKFVYEALGRFKPEDFEKIMYVDSSFRFFKGITNADFKPSKITVFKHFLWDRRDEEFRKNLHNQNKESITYIPYEERTMYIHAGIFFGYVDEMQDLLRDTCKLIATEEVNGTVPTWHDESAFNWLYWKDPERFNIMGGMGDYDAPWRTNGIENSILSFVDNH